MKSSFPGKLAEVSGICVDNFENPVTDGAKAYFLSHFHGDHIVGLDKRDLEDKLYDKKNVFIYATYMCCKIVSYHYKNLKPYVKSLKLGSNLITIYGDSETNQSETYLNVTLIPAGHCLGSTMYLFETTSAKVLYTGDFRIRQNDLSKYSSLHPNGAVVKLDSLYLDTTFINMGYEEFPKRSDSVEETVSLIGQWLKDTNVSVIVETPARYTYEYVFNMIYRELCMKVYVHDDKWDFYRTIQHLVPGITNDCDETRIFLDKYPKMKNPKILKRIRFSAKVWDKWTDDKSCVKIVNDRFTRVCFPTHCSRSELIDFVEYLNPVKVVGFPNPYVVEDQSAVDLTEDFVSSRKAKRCSDGSGARSAKDRKVDAALLKQMFG